MRTKFIHDTLLCFALMGSLTGFAMQEQNGHTQDDNGNGGAVGAAVVGGYGEDSRRECREDSWTRPCMYGLAGVAAVSILANLGLVGGWVGDHFSDSGCDNGFDNDTRFNFTEENITILLEYCRILLSNGTMGRQ